jgi:hypothetical protein
MRRAVGWVVVVGLVVLALGVVHQALIFVSQGQSGAAEAAGRSCLFCHGG